MKHWKWCKKSFGRKVMSVFNISDKMLHKYLMPRVNQYGGYDGNYGCHSMSFSFMGCTFWFSYSTLIAFKIKDYNQVMRENEWGPTTGRHMAHAAQSCRTFQNRVPYEEFIVLLNNQLKASGFGEKDMPFLRVDHNPKTLDRTGYIGFQKVNEDAVPPPKPKKSDYYLFPKKPTAKQKRWVKQQERAAKLREELRDAGQDMLIDVAFV